MRAPTLLAAALLASLLYAAPAASADLPGCESEQVALDAAEDALGTAEAARDDYLIDTLNPARAAYAQALEDKAAATAATRQARSDLNVAKTVFRLDPSEQNRMMRDATRTVYRQAVADLATARATHAAALQDRTTARAGLTPYKQAAAAARADRDTAQHELDACLDRDWTFTDVRVDLSPGRVIIGDLTVTGLAPDTPYYLLPVDYCGDYNCAALGFTDGDGVLASANTPGFGFPGSAVPVLSCRNAEATTTTARVTIRDATLAFVKQVTVRFPAGLC